MNHLIFVPAFVMGCTLFILGIAGISHVGRRRARRRHMAVLTLDELLGRDMRAMRSRELRVELASRWGVVMGGVLAVASYLSW